MLTVAFVRCKSGLFTNFGILFFWSLSHNQWCVNLAQRQRSSTVWPSGDQTQFAVADSVSLSAVQCQRVHWCRRDGASSDANDPIVTVRSTPPPPLSQGPHAPLNAGFVAQYARVRWLDIALRRLYSTWKACDRNRTFPCWYCDFDCDRSRPNFRLRFNDRPNTKNFTLKWHHRWISC